jgi:hypothetical protein
MRMADPDTAATRRAPDLEALRALVGALDADALAAADQVDRSLIRIALDRRPLERVEFAQQMLMALTSFRHVGPSRL